MRAIGLFLVFFYSTASFGAPLSAQDILVRADSHKSPDGKFSFEVKAREFKNNALTKTTIYKVFSKGGDASLIETIFPARSRGRKLLMNHEALWLFLPNVQRPTRVSLQQKLTGEVSNGDLARTNFVDDYSPKLLGRSKWKQKNVFRLGLSAKSDQVTYRYVELLVDEKTFFPLTADFFAVSGKKLKTGTFSRFTKVLGVERSTRFTVKDSLARSKFTVLDYSKFRRENLPDTFFNKESIVD